MNTETDTIQDEADRIVAQVDRYYGYGPCDGANACATDQEFADYWLEGEAGEECGNNDELRDAVEEGLTALYNPDRHDWPETVEHKITAVFSDDGEDEEVVLCEPTVGRADPDTLIDWDLSRDGEHWETVQAYADGSRLGDEVEDRARVLRVVSRIDAGYEDGPSDESPAFGKAREFADYWVAKLFTGLKAADPVGSYAFDALLDLYDGDRHAAPVTEDCQP